MEEFEPWSEEMDEGDYSTAMRIADAIDWSRVRNINLLSLASSVYEMNGEFDEAKDKLLMAFERAPIGKRLLYKLTELSVKTGDLDEAKDYYNEFLDVAAQPEGKRVKYMHETCTACHIKYTKGPRLTECRTCHSASIAAKQSAAAAK